MDLDKLTKGERLAGIAAIVLFLASFIPMWASRGYEVDETIGLPEGYEQKTSLNAWGGYGFTMSLALLLALIVAAVVIAKAAGALDTVSMPVPLGLVYAGAGGLITLIMLFSLLTGPEGINEADVGFGATYVNDRGILLFLGLALAAAVAVGGFLHMKEEGSTPRQFGGTGTGTGTGPAGPPPQRPPGT